MFWKKKEEVKHKEPEPITLYKRIEFLYDRMQELNFKDIKYYKSKIGKKVFIIHKNIYSSKSYEVISKNVKLDEIIFKLEVFEDRVKLEPCPTPLSAHEIDLAILEFENYIDKIYKEHKAKIKELEGENAK